MAIDSPSALGVARMRTVAFSGIDVKDVDVQVQISAGLPRSPLSACPTRRSPNRRERVRSALGAMGLGLPPKRITINLAPADLAKEGSYFDLPIALALLVGMGALPGRDPGLSGARRAGAGWRDPARRRRAACGGRRLGARARPDLSGAVRRRGRLARQRYRDPGRRQPARADQPLQWRAGAGPRSRASPSARRTIPSSPTSRVRRPPNARSRSPPPAARNLLLIGPPGAASRCSRRACLELLHAAGCGRDPGSEHGRQHRRAAARRPADRAAAFPTRTTPLRSPPWSAAARASGRGVARAQGRAVPGRAAGVPPQRPGSLRQPLELGRITVPAPTARHLPGALPAGRGDEPCRCGYLDNPILACAPRRAAPATTRRASPGRCSIASTCTSKCPRCRRSG